MGGVLICTLGMMLYPILLDVSHNTPNTPQCMKHVARLPLLIVELHGCLTRSEHLNHRNIISGKCNT